MFEYIVDDIVELSLSRVTSLVFVVIINYFVLIKDRWKKSIKSKVIEYKLYRMNED